jgi:hypothetical protein
MLMTRQITELEKTEFYKYSDIINKKQVLAPKEFERFLTLTALKEEFSAFPLEIDPKIKNIY